MEKQFGIVPLDIGWRIVSLHGPGNVLESSVKISDHNTLSTAIAKVGEYMASHLKLWPEDTIIIKREK
jgi:hypothetical protein